MAFEKLRFKYHMVGLKVYAEGLIKLTSDPQDRNANPSNISDLNMKFVERYSRKAVSHGKKARDLSSRINVPLDENFASIFDTAQKFYDLCQEYRQSQNKGNN
jgi:hypothetical protein